MSQRHRVVLFGLGNMGRNHLRVIAEDPRFELVAAVDPIQSVLPHPTPYQVPLFGSLDAVENLAFDAAIVASPTETHYAVVKWLLERGKHVLVEKPAAGTAEETQDLRAHAQAARRVLCVGNIERCNPAVAKMREVLATGIIGRAIHADAVRAGRFPAQVKLGNHVILDLAVHELDVLGLLFGKLSVITSFCHAARSAGIFDAAEILLRTSNGISASVHVNWYSPERQRRLRVTGTSGVAELDYINQECFVLGHGLAARAPVIDHVMEEGPGCERMRFPIVKAEPLKVQLGQFHASLLGSTHILCRDEELTESVRLVDEIIGKNLQI